MIVPLSFRSSRRDRSSHDRGRRTGATNGRVGDWFEARSVAISVATAFGNLLGNLVANVRQMWYHSDTVPLWR